MTGISVLLFGSFTSFCIWRVARLADPAVPWGELAGGSAALLLFAAFFVFLKHSTDQRKESHETIRKAHETICVQSANHKDAMEKCTSTFAQTMLTSQKEAAEAHAAVLREARAAHQKCEDTVHALLRGRRDPDRRDPTLNEPA